MSGYKIQFRVLGEEHVIIHTLKKLRFSSLNTRQANISVITMRQFSKIFLGSTTENRRTRAGE